MRRFLFSAAVFVGVIFFALQVIDATSAFAEDDTFSCLDEFNGPLVKVTANGEYGNFIRGSFAAGTRFDARDAWWKHQTVPDVSSQNNWVIQLGGNWSTNPQPRACWAGGMVVGTNADYRNARAAKNGAGSALEHNSNGATIDGIRIHNSGEDGMGSTNGQNFIVRNTWISDISDDGMENDRLATGRIEDTLIDGGYTGISIDPGGDGFGKTKVGNTLTLDGVLLRTDRREYDPYQDYAVFFKTRDSSNAEMGLAVHNSILAFDGFTQPGQWDTANRLQKAWERMRSCSNNLILWTSDAPFPSNFPTPPTCFTIKKGQEARNIWNAAKQNWVNCHPKLQRLPSDPESDYSRCDVDAYGGGGSSTPSGGTTGPIIGKCNQYLSGAAAPTGYGVAWNTLTPSRDLLLSAFCFENGSINYTVGHPDGPDTHYVYRQGYYYTNSWQPMTFTGTFADSSTDWLLREGTATRVNPASGNHFWVGYICQWTGEWKCGCRDQACTQNYWQLQGVVR